MTALTWRPAKQLDDGTWETPGQCDPEVCDDPRCTSSVHLPDRDDVWSAADEDASWLAEDDRARRRGDV